MGDIAVVVYGDIALRGMPEDFTNGNSTSIQVVAFAAMQWPFLLTCINFNPSMDK